MSDTPEPEPTPQADVEQEQEAPSAAPSEDVRVGPEFSDEPEAGASEPAD